MHKATLAQDNSCIWQLLHQTLTMHKAMLQAMHQATLASDTDNAQGIASGNASDNAPTPLGCCLLALLLCAESDTYWAMLTWPL